MCGNSKFNVVTDDIVDLMDIKASSLDGYMNLIYSSPSCRTSVIIHTSTLDFTHYEAIFVKSCVFPSYYGNKVREKRCIFRFSRVTHWTWPQEWHHPLQVNSICSLRVKLSPAAKVSVELEGRGPGDVGAEIGVGRGRGGSWPTVWVTMVIECCHQWALSAELESKTRIGQRWALKSRAGRIRQALCPKCIMSCSQI